jgi:hypothetical protein
MSVQPDRVPRSAGHPRHTFTWSVDGNERTGLSFAKSNETFSEK